MALNMLPISHYMFSALAIINLKYYTLKDTADCSISASIKYQLRFDSLCENKYIIHFLLYGFAFSFRKRCNCVSTKLLLQSQFMCHYQ